jgi:hypothetical protein
MSRRDKVMGVDFPQFVHGGPDEPEELCYLYHLDPPYKHAEHYLGTTELGLEERDKFHQSGAGARLLEVQKEHGGSWHLVRTWAGGRLKERALKMQSGKRYCPECTEHPRAGDEMPDPKRHLYFTRKERAALKAEKEQQERDKEIERNARKHDGPGVEFREFVPLPQPEPLTLTREELAAQDQALTEMEALWIKQAKEKQMKQGEIEAAKEGGQAGEQEVLEGIERGMDPDTALGRHEEIAGWLDREAETPSERAFANAYWTSGRYAGESAMEEIRDPEAYARLDEPAEREQADREIGA